MEREQLKNKFITLVDNEQKCELTIDDVTYNIGIVKRGDNILFYVDNDCLVDFEDIHTETLNEIYSKISR